MKKLSHPFITVIVCAIPLLAVAFYNQYPLVTSDSGSYINIAFLDMFPNDRPIFYSYFIYLASVHYSLWLVVVVQSLMLSFLVVSFNTYVFGIRELGHQVLLVLLCVLFTGVGWYTGQIMPDIFAPITILAGVLFFVVKKPVKYVFLALFFVAILMHLSHILIALLMSVTLVLYAIVTRSWTTVLVKKWILYTASIGFAILAIATSNYNAKKGFILSTQSHVFLMGKMCENGILKEYLDEKCSTKDYKLCAYKNELPIRAYGFMWSDDGPFSKSGGWDSSKTEYNEILSDIVSSPKFLALTVKETLNASFAQLTQLAVGDGMFSFREDDHPYASFFKNELASFKNSQQNLGMFDLVALNQFYHVSFALLLLVGLIVLLRSGNKRFITIFLFLFLFVYFNALVTGGLANILARLNSRAAWVLCLFVFGFLYSKAIKRTI